MPEYIDFSQIFSEFQQQRFYFTKITFSSFFSKVPHKNIIRDFRNFRVPCLALLESTLSLPRIKLTIEILRELTRIWCRINLQRVTFFHLKIILLSGGKKTFLLN